MDNVVVGHLCQDPILRQTRRGGRPMARFTVAVNVWRRVGEVFEQRPPVFHRVVCFGPMAENVSNSLRKGMEVLAVGEWVDDSYSDEQGQRRIQMAMEARVIGPALRRATALVHKVDRKADGEDQRFAGAIDGPAGQADQLGTAGQPLARRGPEPAADRSDAAAGQPPLRPADRRGLHPVPDQPAVRAGDWRGFEPTPDQPPGEAAPPPDLITDDPPDSPPDNPADDSAPGALTHMEAFAAGIAEPAGRRRGGIRRRREPTLEPVPAGGA